MSRHASPEQRYRAVLSVLSGDPVAEVARRNGVSRQTLHNWRRRYTAEGGAGLADRSRRPHLSPARLDPSVEALICSLREQHPDWGAQRLHAALGRLGVGMPPSRTTVHRVLVRNHLLAAADRAGAPVRRAPQDTAGPSVAAEPAGHPGRTEPGNEWLTDLLGAARELVDRLDRALDVLAADTDPCPASCGLCLPEPPAGRAPAQRQPGGVRELGTPVVSLFAQPGPVGLVNYVPARCGHPETHGTRGSG
ncbi:helix-turn-helix domain-containing protein [Streptomyces sp. AK02-01A]|uniref:helix-turn-helix domain-containing protein n=1 Tax=Streptomyces sp. AK02-01A TaxID=3028648 RepID=UPI0029A562CD|nr:helix-turn-helix domain-containing protein [Streptomyces sp. AK02-01A]MDX3852291.1 helix-turn-helix domain-containing protein [Streptomyces sp. AK02-01A]